MSLWIKFPTAYWSDPRLFKLRTILGEMAQLIPVRLWTFAACTVPTGDLSKCSPEHLAEVFHRPNGSEVIHALIIAGFLDKKLRIVGWSELYGLPASRQQAAHKASVARWAVKDRKKDKIEEREADGLRDGIRDGLHDASKESVPVPHSAIIEAFNRICVPPMPEARLTVGRKATIRARWRSDAANSPEPLAWFNELFTKAAASDFLCGRTAGSGNSPFVASFDWLLKPANAQKVHEGNYANRVAGVIGTRSAFAGSF